MLHIDNQILLSFPFSLKLILRIILLGLLLKKEINKGMFEVFI